MRPKNPTKQLEKFVRPFYSEYDPMHNWKHIIRIKKKVIFLKKQYKNIDEKLLNFLILLHGGKSRDTKKKRKKIIEIGYSASWFKLINKPTTKEGKIVWDANCLENVGKYGIKKALTLKKHYKQTMKQTMKLLKKFSKKYKFYTPLGKKLGNPGIKIKKWWLKREGYKLKKIEKKNHIIKILAMCLVFHKNKLLIIKRIKSDAQGSKWDFPGGSLHNSENIDKGIKREIKEETGISIKKVEKLDMIGLRNTRKRNYLLFFYKAKINKKKIKLSKEHDNYKWINPNDLFKYRLNWILPASRKLILKNL
tara:strand:- start:9240 stop:10160 length:921 start_codon:yes stop_codon:yes gene_type:complete